MKTKELAVSCILLSIGFVSHAIIPGFAGGIRPDFLLAMMILAIGLNPSLKMAIACGIIAGILAALSTSFPGGEVLSLIDKFVSAIAVYYIFKVMNNYLVITLIGTLISGLVFVFGAIVMNGLDFSMINLVYIVVIPTAILNALLNGFIANRFMKTLKV